MVILNSAEGSEREFADRRCIETTGRGERHAVYGPYESLSAGHYVATFHLARSDESAQNPDEVCAILDVACDEGRTVVAIDLLLVRDLTSELRPFCLPFSLTSGATVEFRVRGSGRIPVIIADDATAQIGEERRSQKTALPDCRLLRETPGEIVGLFAQGRAPRAVDSGFQFTVDDIVLFAEQRDDVNFIDEVFHQKAYNLRVDRDLCVIDVGMNVGLTSLTFAARDRVREVHAFEPFASTFQKALANLALNPGIAGKIHPHNAGLSDRDEEATILVPDTSDSGSRATFDVAGGTPHRLRLLDAAQTLGPIVDAARAKGRFVIAKVDCEGSEFAIFRSLAAANLLGSIDAFMVEWHRVFPDKRATDLTQPLLDRGFTVIDLSPPEGNGFFYAVKVGVG